MLDLMNSRRAALGAALLFVAGAAAYHSFQRKSEVAPKAEAGRFRRDALTIETAGGPLRLDVELAVTAAEQSQGLMFRTSLPDTQGMLFLHDKPGEVRMWMRNTYIPLDMVFIRADGTVHRIAAMTEPLSETVIASLGPVTAVLELNGGAAQRLGVKPGDRVRHAHFVGKDAVAPRNK